MAKTAGKNGKTVDCWTSEGACMKVPKVPLSGLYNPCLRRLEQRQDGVWESVLMNATFTTPYQPEFEDRIPRRLATSEEVSMVEDRLGRWRGFAEGKK